MFIELFMVRKWENIGSNYREITAPNLMTDPIGIYAYIFLVGDDSGTQ